MVGKSNMQFHDLSVVRGTIPALNRWGHLHSLLGCWDFTFASSCFPLLCPFLQSGSGPISAKVSS